MRLSSEYVRMFKRAGFVLARTAKGGHQMWRCPCGHAQLVCPGSPGKGRGAANMKADITRALKVCNQRQETAA